MLHPVSDQAEIELISVQLPSGAPYQVLTLDEADFIEELTESYERAFKFAHPSDLMELDRVVYSEMLCWRWGMWLSRGVAYGPMGVDTKTLPRNLADDMKRVSTEIRLTKKSMGMDKPARDKAQGEDSVPYYLERLRECALVFGIHRVNQLDRALELLNQAFGMATFWKNANERERRMMHLTAEDIVMWMLETAMPEYEEIDRYFRENEQKYWVRKL